MLRFSIIVPVYCASKYLKKCIESILNQDYKLFELILVDDGSKDNSLDICKQYAVKDDRIKVIHQSNKGVVYARQKGIDSAIGEYAIFVDSDDYIKKEYLSIFNNIIEQYEPDVLLCDYYSFNKKISVIKSDIKKGFYDKQRISKELLPKLIMNNSGEEFPKALWSKAFRLELYKKYQLTNTNVNMGEDSACVIPIVFNCNSLYKIDYPLYFYRISSGSITNSRTIFAFEGPLIRLAHIRKYINFDVADLKQQSYRMMSLSVYTVVSSRYNDTRRNKDIDGEIIEYLNNSIVNNSIHKCSFDILKIKLWFRVLILRYRLLTFFHISKLVYGLFKKV